MSECGWLSDRIPAVALGRAEWTPEESRHLSECRPCQEEWELVQVASRLGEEMVSPAATEKVVLRRLQLERDQVQPRRRTWAFTGLAAAATIAAAVWSGAFSGRQATEAPARTAVVARPSIPLPELENLQPAELDSVLQTMDEGVATDPAPDSLEPNDLQNDELELILDSWEG